MEEIRLNWRQIKLPTFAFLVYILLIPFESILAVPIIVVVSYATISAVITSLLVLIYLIFIGKPIKLTKSAIPWIAYFIWAGISIYWSIDRSLSSFNYIFISKHLFFLIIISSYPFNFSEKRLIRHGIIASGILLSLAVFFSTYKLGGLSSLVRATIANGYYKANPEHIGDSFLIPISFLIVDFVKAKKFNFLDFVAISIIFIALVVTGSRASFLSLLGTVVTLIIIYRKSKNEKKVILSSAFGLALAGILIFSLYPTLVDRFANIQDLDRYSSNRLPLWRETFQLYYEKPFAGFGWGVFRDLPSVLAQESKTAHNIILQSLIENGVVGACLMLFALIPPFIYKTYDDFSAAAKASIVGILITSMFLYTINYDYFWLAMILGVISERGYSKSKRSEPTETNPPAKKTVPITDIA